MRKGRTQFRAVPAALIVALLGGCTQLVWFKPGASESDRVIAEGRCLSLAHAQIPPAPTTTIVGGGFITPRVTNCSRAHNETSCVTVGGYYVPPTFMTYDANKGARNEVFSGCMNAAGWTLRTPEEIQAAMESDRTKGFNHGMRDRADDACDTVPPDIRKPEEWHAGCLSGQQAR